MQNRENEGLFSLIICKDNHQTNKLLLETHKKGTLHAKILTPSRPNECSGHLWILLCLTPDDFTRQWGTSWTGKG